MNKNKHLKWWNIKSTRYNQMMSSTPSKWSRNSEYMNTYSNVQQDQQRKEYPSISRARNYQHHNLHPSAPKNGQPKELPSSLYQKNYHQHHNTNPSSISTLWNISKNKIKMIIYTWRKRRQLRQQQRRQSQRYNDRYWYDGINENNNNNNDNKNSEYANIQVKYDNYKNKSNFEERYQKKKELSYNHPDDDRSWSDYDHDKIENFNRPLLPPVWNNNSNDQSYNKNIHHKNNKAFSRTIIPRWEKSDLKRKQYRFQYKGQTIILNLFMDEILRQKYYKAQRTYQYFGDTPPPDWLVSYYKMFLSHPDDHAAVNTLLDQIHCSTVAAIGAVDTDVLLEQVVSFVQSAISYDPKTATKLNDSRNRYPYETLFDQKGVCVDKSLLMARLATALGYDCVLFVFESANHMGVGIRVPTGYGNFQNQDYAFIETTAAVNAPIGQIPYNSIDNIQLDSKPTLVPISSSDNDKIYSKIVENKGRESYQKKRYGTDFFTLNPEQQQLKEQMILLQEDMEYYKQQIKRYDDEYSNKPLPAEEYEQCKDMHEEFNRRVDTYNELIKRYCISNNQQQGTVSR